MSARILVVDDILANRRLMKAKLEAKYYTVDMAVDGPEAIRKAEEGSPQIILLDVMMPGMDGYEVCRRLKANPRTRHIPIVMLTALTDAEDRVRGLKAGADDFLSKPVDDFSLMARLEALSRYNAVAHELRQREANSRSVHHFTEDELRHLSKPANILIVDSDRNAVKRIGDRLKTAGHTVSLWSDQGAADLQSLDLVILALSNQPHDPLRLCAFLQSLEMGREFSIIAIYDKSDQYRAHEALRLGAGDTIELPVDEQELLVRVRTQLKRSRYLQILRERVDRGVELSVIDQLTELYNRRFMHSRLEQWITRSSVNGPPVCVVALDVDHFKLINDAYGHETGDEILRAFAKRIRKNVRPKDVACRMGGEEFLVILPETCPDMAMLGAERIRQAIASEPFRIERTGVEIDVTVSAGVAHYNSKEDTVSDILHRADQALYRAKQGGRNRIESMAA